MVMMAAMVIVIVVLMMTRLAMLMLVRMMIFFFMAVVVTRAPRMRHRVQTNITDHLCQSPFFGQATQTQLNAV